jgi:hypothetical protein
MRAGVSGGRYCRRLWGARTIPFTFILSRVRSVR